MKIQEYIEAVRCGVWKATADVNGPVDDVRLTIHLDEQSNVTQEREKACTVELSVFYSSAWLSSAKQPEAQTEPAI